MKLPIFSKRPNPEEAEQWEILNNLKQYRNKLDKQIVCWEFEGSKDRFRNSFDEIIDYLKTEKVKSIIKNLTEDSSNKISPRDEITEVMIQDERNIVKPYNLEEEILQKSFREKVPSEILEQSITIEYALAHMLFEEITGKFIREYSGLRRMDPQDANKKMKYLKSIILGLLDAFALIVANTKPKAIEKDLRHISYTLSTYFFLTTKIHINRN
jgi:hypothetical protein